MKTVDDSVGLDVHQYPTVIAVADGGRGGEVRLYGEISSDLDITVTVSGGGNIDVFWRTRNQQLVRVASAR